MHSSNNKMGPLFALLACIAAPLAGGVAAVAEPSPAAADAPPALEELLVTGSLAPQPALTSAVTVLDAAAIRALHRRDVAELLATVPGLLVERQGGPGGLTAVSVRGGEANFTLVLLDGVAVNDPTNTRGGSFDFGNLDPALIERIEVVRGAQSAVYGSDALAGVINIITRRPQAGHRQQARSELGKDGYWSAGLAAQGAADAIDYALALGAQDDGEPVEDSARENHSAQFRLGWQAAPGQRVHGGFRYLSGDRAGFPEQSGGPAYAQDATLEHADYRERIADLGWDAAVTAAWRSALTASRFEHRESYASPGIAPYFDVPPNGADTQFTRDQLRWVNSVDTAFDVNLQLGAEYRAEDGESRGYVAFFGERNPTDFELDRDTTGMFAGITATPWAPLSLHAVARRDEPEGFAAQDAWQAGVRLDLTAAVALLVNAGDAYKLPSFFALGNPLVGNADLDPETVTSWDAGLAWTAGPSLAVTATWFDADYRDLIDFDDATFRNVNRQRVKTSGAEIAAQWSPGAAWSLRGFGTYTDIDVPADDTVLTGRPQWSAGVVAQWDVARAWQAVLDYRYGGEQWSSSRHTGEQMNVELPDYHRVDAVLHFRPLPRWQWQLALDNVLDEDYDTAIGFAAPGRMLRLGLRWQSD